MSCFACFSVSLQTQLYFWGRNMYMQQWTSSFKKYFSKNTFYLFFNSAKTNGFHFTSLLVTDIVNHDIRNLTNQKGKIASSLMTVFSIAPSTRKRNWNSKSLTTSDMYFKKISYSFFVIFTILF